MLNPLCFLHLAVSIPVFFSPIRRKLVIIITLFKSQIILAEHKCSTNWGDCKSNKSNRINQSNQSNQMLFLRRGENRSSRRKTTRSRVENQQTLPTYDAGSGNRTRDSLMEGERSHHCAIPALLVPTNCTVQL